MNFTRSSKTVIPVTCIILIIGLLNLNPITTPQLRLTYIWIARTILIITLLSFASYGFFIHIIRSQINEWTKNVSLMLYTFFLFFFLLEAIFTFVPYSHGVGYTLASRNWFRIYWKTNSDGYRDIAFNLSQDTAKTKVVILGDSFTAGQGIKNTDKRYTDLLRDHLDDSYRLYNLGKPGSDTRNEYQRLVSFPLKPDIIVLQYFGNDILESAYEAHNINIRSQELFTPYNNVSGLLRPIIKGSYFVNYFYWKFPQSDMNGFNNFIIQSYQNSEILKKHFQDLDRFIEYSSTNHVKFMVLIFPYMTDMESSKYFTIPIELHFREKNVPVLNLTDLIKAIPAQFRTANSNDAHPGEDVHKAVADTLLLFLRQQVDISKKSNKLYK